MSESVTTNAYQIKQRVLLINEASEYKWNDYSHSAANDPFILQLFVKCLHIPLQDRCVRMQKKGFETMWLI